MVNYNPPLQGWADRDEDPEWMENAIARVRARQRKSKSSENRNSGTYVFYDPPLRVLLNEAAHRRGIGVTGYCRRAIAAFIAHDLKMPLGEVTRHMAKPTMENKGARKRTFDDGQGFGPWLIERLQELR